MGGDRPREEEDDHSLMATSGFHTDTGDRVTGMNQTSHMILSMEDSCLNSRGHSAPFEPCAA